MCIFGSAYLWYIHEERLVMHLVTTCKAQRINPRTLINHSASTKVGGNEFRHSFVEITNTCHLLTWSGRCQPTNARLGNIVSGFAK